MTPMASTDRITHAGAVVYRGEWNRPEYLLVSSSRGGEWVLPKGHVESGETLEAAAKRELQEEAGIIAETVQPLTTIAYEKPDEKARAAFFLMRFIGPTKPAERREIQWLPFDGACRLLSFDDSKKVLRKADRWLRQARFTK
jgi:8-oxo-dGTP pyrophosphatase MutT (NUDIX family)